MSHALLQKLLLLMKQYAIRSVPLLPHRAKAMGKTCYLAATVGMMLAAVWLAGLLAGVVALSASSGGPGDALYIGYTQGAYISDFPLPEETVTAEFWTKLFPVGWGIVVF